MGRKITDDTGHVRLDCQEFTASSSSFIHLTRLQAWDGHRAASGSPKTRQKMHLPAQSTWRMGLEFTHHAPPTPPGGHARGASARHSTHTEPAGASGAAGAAPCTCRGRLRAAILFGTPPPESLTMGDAGRHIVTPHAESPVAPSLGRSAGHW